MKYLSSFFFSSVCLLAGVTAYAGDAANIRVALSIEQQPVRTALKQLSDQAGVQVLLRVDNISVDGVISPKIQGEVTLQTALEKLLKDTGLKYEFVSDRAVRISAATDAPKAPRGGDSPKSTESHSTTMKPASENFSSNTEASTSKSSSELQEIVVTAQKREERLIDVPQSVTVLSSETLQKMGAFQFRDFADTVPGLSFNSTGAGFTQVTLRGVTMGTDLGPTVSVYIDDVPYGAGGAGAGGTRLALDVGLFDIDRVEVLRGPQGTLYGASSMGGLVKYATKAPSTQSFNGQALTSISSTEQGGVSYNGSAGVNMPISPDRVALRVSGFYSHDGGYIDNLTVGQNDVNRSNIYGGRADLLLTPTDALSIRFAAFMQHIDRDGMAAADFTYEGVPIDGSLEQRRLAVEPFEQRFSSASGTIAYDLKWAELTSITSYQRTETDLQYDLSPVWVPLAEAFGSFFSAAGFAEIGDMKKFVEEVRLASQGDSQFDWIVGGFYSREDVVGEDMFRFVGLDGQSAPNDFWHGQADSTRKEYAAFGNLTWHLTDRLDVTAGLRYARHRTENTGGVFGLFGNNALTKTKSEDDVNTYLANARYHFGDRANLYVRYATGYRPGGDNSVARDPVTGAPLAPPRFKADNLKSYEVGFKSETGDRRLGVDVAAYRINWSDIQTQAIRNGIGVIANAPEAHINGVELGLTARPTDALSVMGTVTYMDAKLAADAPDISASKNERLPNVPEYMASFNIDYYFSGQWQPTIGATVRHVSDRTAGWDASTTQPQYLSPAYEVVDLRTGLTIGSIYAQLYLRNVFDERAQLSTYNWNRAWAQPGILQPRTIGLMASKQF